MLCENCNKNPAKTFSSCQVNGIEKELYLCLDCAGDGNNVNKLKFFTSPQTSDKVCTCGTKFDDISQSGYVGCADCYTFFQTELQPVIRALHTKPYHTGKKKLSKLEIYTAQLEKARKNNFHSLAKKLEEQIKNLKEMQDERI